ncbi:MAG: exopolysaccharide biosynthesis glycosyltransferase EpsD [Myxococcaceae bacterium]
MVQLSVVVATFNRKDLIIRLVKQLGKQTLPPSQYEVVVVDDGSSESPKQALEALKVPCGLTVVEQKNAGAAAARHRGVLEAKGKVVIITDDDMQVEPMFVERHLRHHLSGPPKCVLGRIHPDPGLASMPIFERWYAYLLDKHVATLKSGRTPIPGTALFTGNVSMRREDYLAAGGFDLALGQSEDSELGLRLEQHGVEFIFDEQAFTLHGSDHTSYEKWLRRAHRYGAFDHRIAQKHPNVNHASPYRFLFSLNPLARPLLVAALVAPDASEPVSSAAMKASELLDKAGLERLAFMGTSVVYTMEYYRGLREECGSLGTALSDLVRFAAMDGKTRLAKIALAARRKLHA